MGIKCERTGRWGKRGVRGEAEVVFSDVSVYPESYKP
jgi:hypothetical protein